MAVNQTTIEAVRVWEADGTTVRYPWDPAKWYLIRDDKPFLDILTRGHPAQFKEKKQKLMDLNEELTSENCGERLQWQRWNLSEQLSRKRQFGEVSVDLKVPKDSSLHCYVIPAAIFTFCDILTMVNDVESELGVAIAWDHDPESIERGRIWSLPQLRSQLMDDNEMLNSIEVEILAAESIRRNPFIELGPISRSDTPLSENALVSQWALRRSGQLRSLTDDLKRDIAVERDQGDLKNPDRRQQKIDFDIERLDVLLCRSDALSTRLSQIVNEVEIGTPIQLSPLFQRDYRLRLLLRAFASSPSEAIADSQSVRSTYPPVLLNHLWELWGVVWIAKQLRGLGFQGKCSSESIKSIKRWSWNLKKDGVVIKLDFEAEPVFIDYEFMPPVHERALPALEWAARHQKVNSNRPFLGSEEKCSPDYLVRIITSTSRSLLVGDAVLATPEHHKKMISKSETKPQVVERYRRTIGWVDGDRIIRCHPLGAFVVFPPTVQDWSELETIPQARDCMFLCPSPKGDGEASQRLRTLLEAIVPGCSI